MLVSGNIKDTRTYLRKLKGQGKSVGLVPTMGALHEGHLSLVDTCIAENDISVVSIFVNPIQFNNKADFERYPRDVEKDVELIRNRGCHLAFIPSEREIYPTEDKRVYDFGMLDKHMEGKYRPGHFNGVAQVVTRLFNIISPDKAYFGEKDFQQLTIIKALVNQLNLPVQIIPCPTIRETDGLAMSSRNRLLNSVERKSSARIPEVLFRAKALAGKMTVEQLKDFVRQEIDANPNLHTEYFEIVEETGLQPVKEWPENVKLVGCVAVRIGLVRLIDNIKFS